MLTKLLFTGLLIAAVVLWLRFRNSPAKQQTASSRQIRQPDATAADTRQPLIVAIALALGLLLITASYFYLDWQAEHTEVQVRVVNTRTGEVSLYRAYQNQVHGRRFRSMDGIEISVSDVERIETVLIQD
jgi:hypothetical protein